MAAAARQPKRPDGEMVQTSCSIPADVYAKLKTMAAKEERSISAMIAKACKDFVERKPEK